MCDATMLAFAIWKRGMERAEERRARGTEADADAGDPWGLEQGELEDREARGMMVDVMVVSLSIARGMEEAMLIGWPMGEKDEFASLGPNLTAMLLSEVMSVRCKLAALDINVSSSKWGEGEVLIGTGPARSVCQARGVFGGVEGVSGMDGGKLPGGADAT